MKARTHSLKTWPEYYDAVASGAKPFEVRKDDRGFQVGDTLLLRKWLPAIPADNYPGQYTGAWIKRRVTYILNGPGFGVEAGFCILGLGRLPKKRKAAPPQTRPVQLEARTRVDDEPPQTRPQ